MKAHNKPRVITNCVADHYTDADERIIEYSFGGDGKGGTLGGLIRFSWWQGKPLVELYRHEQEIEIRVSEADKR